ncbi:MAG: mechanosensitive ion channel domain-containing protein [Planctomycetota bacterium]
MRHPLHVGFWLLTLWMSAALSAAAQSEAPERLDAELRADVKAMDWVALAEDIWTAELFHLGGTAVRLNQIVIALLVILVGLWLARRLSRRVSHRMRKHPRIDPNLAAAAEKIIFFVATAIVMFLALPIAGIPVTIFTVLGSAVAIGIGFGAQNLCNNLISGLILMIERPIRLGDIVEVEGHEGRIDDIGNRCTRIRRFDGIDVLVPNSALLQNPVVNWTLKDTDIRGKVAVGVAYGSPVSLVRDLIAQAVDEHGRIHKTPSPEVLFTDFGDNALAFEVFFWTSVTRPLDLRRIQSDLRYRIEHLFRDAQITIAFPQRDVHLDMAKPLEVRLHRDPPNEPTEKTATPDTPEGLSPAD